jgi:hypothetical protein
MELGLSSPDILHKQKQQRLSGLLTDIILSQHDDKSKYILLSISVEFAT